VQSLSPSEAAQMLFERYGDEVYRYIRFTVGDLTEADDILQEVFLRVLQSWNRFMNKSSSKTWLWSITNNCIKENFRKRKRVRNNVVLNDDFRDDTKGYPMLALQLEQSLQCLSVTQRQVFVERIIHEKSTTETAEELGWGESKVRTTLHRALKKIQTWFAEGRISDEQS
jgi:RNA polymerase sigma-70 factor, ECF subfamily